jgi:hypothetical protein
MGGTMGYGRWSLFPYSAADLEHDIETHERVSTLGRE